MDHLGHRRKADMMLNDKIAVVYGAGGAIGGAVARAFAREGAKLFVTGRGRAPVEVVAKNIVSAGGYAEAAEVDTLDEQAVDKHLRSVVDKARRVDISFNAVGISDKKMLGVPLIEMDVEQVLSTDQCVHDVVLPDRTRCRKAHDPEQIRGDHDRHRTPRTNGHPIERRLRSGAGCQGGTHTRPVI
jgi:shikimate 5-dehydrogenase